MGNNRKIQTDQNPDHVTFKILLGKDKEELSQKYGIQQIIVEKEANRIPFAQLHIIDGEAAKQEFEGSNTDLFLPGQIIEITSGYHSDEATIFKGIIVKHSVKIRDNSSLLIIECRDQFFQSTLNRRNEYYYNTTDSDLLADLGSKYLGEVSVKETAYTHPEIVQYYASDWDFMVSRAQASGMLVFLDDNSLNIKKPSLNEAPIETVAFGATILELDAEIDARHQNNSYKSFAWNKADQEISEAEAAETGVKINSNISIDELAKVGNVEELSLIHGGSLPPELLQSWIDAKSKFQEMAAVRGRVRFKGIPTIKPGNRINLQGISDRFNGEVFVSAIRHTLKDGDWLLDVQFGLNPKWFSETYDDIIDIPAAGLIPAVNGLQIGKVTLLEGDPKGEDRIKIKLPIVDNKMEGIWARLALPDAGENRGIVFRPEIDDEVIVGFINDDPNYAVVLGMLNSSANPAPIVASDDNHEKGIITRGEMKLIFDDDKKSIIIETPSGKKVSIDEDAGVIQLEDENNNKILMDPDGILIESGKDIQFKATGDIKAEGVNVELKAQAEFKAEGSAGAEVSSSAVAVLKGSIVQIN